MQILLVDDHSLFRQGLKFLLSDLDESIEFIEAESCQQALAFNAHSVDLILLDYHLLKDQEKHFQDFYKIVIIETLQNI